MLDSGNSLIGDLNPAKRTQGASSVAIMNLMGYDAMALGAGDLSMGLDVIRQRQAEAKFPFLSANAVVSGTTELVATPYITREIGSGSGGYLGPVRQGNSPHPRNTGHRPLRRGEQGHSRNQGIGRISSSCCPMRPARLDQAIAVTVPGIDWIMEGSLSTQT